jgi:hypothetical protein
MSGINSLPKYHKDRPFEDPVLRCDACQELMRAEVLRKQGMCVCGNRRVKNVLTLRGQEEMDQIAAWGIDPEWMALFEEVDEDA